METRGNDMKTGETVRKLGETVGKLGETVGKYPHNVLYIFAKTK